MTLASSRNRLTRSAAACASRLDHRPGVRPQHCELHVNAHGVTLHVPPGTTVSVNGRVVDGLIALRPDDSVAFDHVMARLSSIESASPIRHGAGHFPTPANDDPVNWVISGAGNSEDYLIGTARGGCTWGTGRGLPLALAGERGKRQPQQAYFRNSGPARKSSSACVQVYRAVSRNPI